MLKHLTSQQDWNQKNLSQKGFTLIELLVVIVILGVLAAVVVFAVGGITDKGQKAACQSDANTIRTAAEAYAANDPTGQYPSSLSALSPKFLSNGTSDYVTYSGGGASFSLAWKGKCATSSDLSGINP